MSSFELKQDDFDRAWVSAGRAFRLIQVMKLNEVDCQATTQGGPSMFSQDEEWTVTEEKRRTFWAAYFLDIFLSSIRHHSLTFTEQAICTKLPSPEAAFQRGDPVSTRFLPEVMESTDNELLGTGLESIFVHTFTPTLPFSCANFFANCFPGGYQAELMDIVMVLRGLADMSPFAKGYLDRLETDLSMGTYSIMDQFMSFS
ncbi:hypothetical protein B0I35DRAFT_484884 [Stachybotrys elegans]|uniref:Xylanolytic transcriptional activator regulatory domain-containing protein n=1 Tax=Stachybotrys elegans TaxID=80388 RepID=A0A8K0SDQ1_9HYPO|nr:hypothetical protein B0I35DRAFT_484884 [Stachybotrys elegans]